MGPFIISMALVLPVNVMSYVVWLLVLKLTNATFHIVLILFMTWDFHVTSYLYKKTCYVSQIQVVQILISIENDLRILH